MPASEGCGAVRAATQCIMGTCAATSAGRFFKWMWAPTRLARTARSSRIRRLQVEAGRPIPKARRSSSPRPRITSQPGLLAAGSTPKRSSTAAAVPLAVSVAMTRQAPLGRISRLSLRSVHHRCRRTSKTSGLRSLASKSASWVSTLAGSSAMVRTGSPDGCSNCTTPTGGGASRRTTPTQCSRPVMVHSRRLRQVNETLLAAGSMVQVPVRLACGWSIAVTAGSLRSQRVFMTTPEGVISWSGGVVEPSPAPGPLGGSDGQPAHQRHSGN
jgi:hypothetical protein